MLITIATNYGSLAGATKSSDVLHRFSIKHPGSIQGDTHFNPYFFRKLKESKTVG